MKKFLIKVSGEQFEVEVEEVTTGFGTDVATKPVGVAFTKSGNGTPKPAKKNGQITIDSPMPGSIRNLHVAVGDEVKEGQSLFVLEAMKMENEIAAPTSGKIVGIEVNVGEPVAAGQTIIIME